MNIFDAWNGEKQKLDARDNLNFYIKPREIWYTKMGKNVGFEQDGKAKFLRPVLVIKKVGNLFFIAPMTSKGKSLSIFYHHCQAVKLQNPKHKHSSYILLSQVKIMDKRRFIEHIGSVSENEFQHIKQKLRTLLF